MRSEIVCIINITGLYWKPVLNSFGIFIKVESLQSKLLPVVQQKFNPNPENVWQNFTCLSVPGF
jgi:hypothetical protein